MRQTSTDPITAKNIASKPSIQKGSNLTCQTIKPQTLFDLMYDGFYALYQLNRGAIPDDGTQFRNSIMSFLNQFEHDAKTLSLHEDDIEDAKYAFCAALDEFVLCSNSTIRSEWERRPLQLTLFGEQLAGEHFFDKLEHLRARGQTRFQALEIYHMCLLLGFQGKYRLDFTEKLHYLTARVGDEVAAHKGGHTSFSPHWQRPDHVSHQLKHDVPIWFIATLFFFVAILVFTVLNNSLNQSTQSTLAPYHDIVQIAPKAANISIILP